MLLAPAVQILIPKRNLSFDITTAGNRRPGCFFFFTTNSAVKSSTCISCRDIVTTPVAWMPVSHVIATPPPSMMTFITIQSKGHQGSVARFLPFTCHRLRRRQVGPVSSHSRPLAERNRGRSFNLQKSKYLLQMLRCFHEIFQVASSLTALQLCLCVDRHATLYCKVFIKLAAINTRAEEESGVGQS